MSKAKQSKKRFSRRFAPQNDKKGNMLDINFIRQNQEKVKEGIKNKGFDPDIVDKVLQINKKRLSLIAEIEKFRQERNKLPKDNVKRGKEVRKELQHLEPELKNVEQELKVVLLQIPNLPAEDVPVGKDESENVVIKKWGEPIEFNFQPKDHLELGELLGIIDVERAAKVSGSRFFYLKNEAVILEFALFRFAFDTLVKEGFKPVIPPVLISLKSMEGMGYLVGESREDMYILDKDDLVLVGTSEQSIGPMHQDETFTEKNLPIRYVGSSTCFRREAGSYGKDTRGILRAHQFNKVEMFSYVEPEDSDKEHEYLLSREEKLMQALGLPYQVVKMCTGDLGMTASRKYDIEVWMPGQDCYRETHSTSNTTDYQARGLNIKYQKSGNETSYLHMLNGTAFSERPIVAILENYQQEDGTVTIPEVLQKFTGFSKITPK